MGFRSAMYQGRGMDDQYLSWQGGFEMTQPVISQDCRDLFVIIPFRCQDGSKFLHVSDRIQPGRD